MSWSWLLGALSVLSVGMLVGSAIGLPMLVARLSVDHFLHPPKHRRHGWAWNCTGALLVILGVVMLFVPGQGLLTILMGVALMDFPGRTALLSVLLRRPALQRALNALRSRQGKPPLQFPSAQ